MKILVTGGAGYIGSHTCLELLCAGYDVVVVDNLVNSKRQSLVRVEQLAGRPLSFYRADVGDKSALQKIFSAHAIEAVIHFAGLKAVGESVSMPLDYYRNNIAGTIFLCEAMAEAGVKRIVFSSSATVYGDPVSVPIKEDFPVSATNPYGRSKLIVEEILRDVQVSDPEWRIAILRYFNPVGAHESGRIGESPVGTPNNLMPYVSQVAGGKREYLTIFGNDYPTLDGTGVRDYIHVVDLACGHLNALVALSKISGVLTVNLGRGKGYSVLEVVNAFAQASGRAVPYKFVDRRPGDIACCYSDPSLAADLLGWRAMRGLGDMCVDAWRWQSMNPDGYGTGVD